MSVSSLVRLCPPDLAIRLFDVGAAGGLKDRWSTARSVVSAVLFEPRDGGERRQEGRDIVWPVALGPSAGRATLHLTKLANMSSTLRPNADALAPFRRKPADVAVVGTHDMPVSTLDEVVDREGIRADVLKIDTQGTELGILQGARRALDESVFLAEIEVSFFERYCGQALFGDVVAFMAQAGFEFIDISRLRRYRYDSTAGARSADRNEPSGRLAYADALFVLEGRRLADRLKGMSPASAQELVLKLLVSLAVYGKADLAAHCLDRFAAHVDPSLRQRLARHFEPRGAWLKRWFAPMRR